MKINFAHYRTQGIDYAVFDAKSRSHTKQSKSALLVDLTNAARSRGLKIDKSALVYTEGMQIRFFGDTDLIRYLDNNDVPQWTNYIEV